MNNGEKIRFDLIVYYLVIWVELPLSFIMNIIALGIMAWGTIDADSSIAGWRWLMILLLFMCIGVVIYGAIEWYGLFKWRRFGLYMLYIEVAQGIAGNVREFLSGDKEILLVLVGILIMAVKLICFIRLRDNFE